MSLSLLDVVDLAVDSSCWWLSGSLTLGLDEARFDGSHLRFSPVKSVKSPDDGMTLDIRHRFVVPFRPTFAMITVLCQNEIGLLRYRFVASRRTSQGALRRRRLAPP